MPDGSFEPGFVVERIPSVGYTYGEVAHDADGARCWCRPDIVYADGSHPSGPGRPGDWLPQDEKVP